MSNCVYVDYGDYTLELHRAEVRRARKEHRCNECGETIPRGNTYECVTALYDGDFWRHKTCARCLLVRADYFRDGFAYGCMVEDWLENFDFDYRDGIPADFAPCGKPAAALTPEETDG